MLVMTRSASAKVSAMADSGAGRGDCSRRNADARQKCRRQRHFGNSVFRPTLTPSSGHQPLTKSRLSVTIPSRGGIMANLDNALRQLREERKQVQLRVEKLYQAISVIESLDGSGAPRKSGRPTRFVSAVSRRRMAQAQRARWAKAKGHAPKPKRTISAAGRKRIAAAQRARWAKVKNAS